MHRAEIDADHKFLMGNNREYLRINGSEPEIQIGPTTLLWIAVQHESAQLLKPSHLAKKVLHRFGIEPNAKS